MADNPTQNVNENATTDDTQNDEAIVAEIHCMRMILDKLGHRDLQPTSC